MNLLHEEDPGKELLRLGNKWDRVFVIANLGGVCGKLKLRVRRVLIVLPAEYK